MKENWESSLAIILKEEGGNDDDPDDPGGRTSRGIIQREWNVYRQTHPNRPSDVWNASNEDVADIYHSNYWNPYCDSLPAGVDLVFFNTSVNSGRQQAVKELQRALGISADGMMGMITMSALNSNNTSTRQSAFLIKDMCERRRAYYKQLKTFWKYGKGWLGRTDRVEKAALEMAAKSPAKVVVSKYPQVDTKPAQPEITVSPKGYPTQTSDPVIPPEASGTASAGTGSIMGFIEQIKDQLQQFPNTVKVVQYLLLAVTIVGICYTVYGLVRKSRIKAAMSNV